MERIENLNVTINGEVPTVPIEIILREGRAAEPLKTVNPQPIIITGDIDSVLHYIRDRYDDEKINKGPIVIYSDDPKNIFIEFREDPTNPNGNIIRGELQEHPDLKNFMFNDKNVFDNKRFLDVIKKNAHCFQSIAQAKSLVKNLQNFQAKFTTEVADIDDKKGNTDFRVKTILDSSKSGIPQELTFNTPLFNGGPKKEFTVEVEIDTVMVANRPEAKFGFCSMELTQMIRDNAEEIINNQIEGICSYFTCIRAAK